MAAGATPGIKCSGIAPFLAVVAVQAEKTMTEAAWLSATDPEPMLHFLRGKASDRKLRLFAVACCRLVSDQIGDERFRQALDVAERFAEGEANEEERREAEAATRGAWNMPAEAAARGALTEDPFVAAAVAAHHAAWAAPSSPRAMERTSQAALLRCLLGPLPFHLPLLEASWLFSSDRIAVKLARTIYSERAFHLLPILADALEDGGCADELILTHCRGPGPHARGCWLVDCLLGKE
jgi:hypothetical protein